MSRIEQADQARAWLRSKGFDAVVEDRDGLAGRAAGTTVAPAARRQVVGPAVHVASAQLRWVVDTLRAGTARSL
jgi:hypothetical protein